MARCKVSLTLVDYVRSHVAMTSDQGPVIQSALLRGELVRLRKERGLTQQQVAAAMEWSPSKLIRVEGGASSIAKVDLDALLTEYGVTSESHRERLHALNRGAKETGWWAAYKDDVSTDYLSYVGFEAGAAFIRQFQIGVMPGLLQTADYAEVVNSVGQSEPETVRTLVRLRMQRQSELSQRFSPPRQYFVLDEGVIRRHVGIKRNRAIMPNQLRSIADRAERDRLVTVRVIPFETGAHPGLIDPFTLLEFEAGLPDILFFDANRSALMISGDDPEVAKYAEYFEEILEDALSAEASIELIRKVADDMS
jgi:transcriptional regulator with XRE-family HTH domain